MSHRSIVTAMVRTRMLGVLRCGTPQDVRSLRFGGMTMGDPAFRGSLLLIRVDMSEQLDE
jgi:hypothetical protein